MNKFPHILQSFTLLSIVFALALLGPPTIRNASSLNVGACVALDFTAPQEFGSGLGASLVTAADMNDDGRQDFVTLGSSGVSILLGDGLGGFSHLASYDATGSASVLVSDSIWME